MAEEQMHFGQPRKHPSWRAAAGRRGAGEGGKTALASGKGKKKKKWEKKKQNVSSDFLCATTAPAASAGSTRRMGWGYWCPKSCVPLTGPLVVRWVAAGGCMSLQGRWAGRGLNGEESSCQLGRGHPGTLCPQGQGDLTQQMPTAAGQAASGVGLTARFLPKPLAPPALK